MAVRCQTAMSCKEAFRTKIHKNRRVCEPSDTTREMVNGLGSPARHAAGIMVSQQEPFCLSSSSYSSMRKRLLPYWI